ncbi:XRE family transcriptional regulator [Pseudomonas sp. NPDC090202]|uniref:XRE family transcriptional regulator n=1 Tax=Pseudomonas sp. NPDC090202 TaxID=3364476 RepID=UPI0038115095
MKCIQHYDPPSAGDLAGLKKELNFTSPQMAELTGLAQGAHWRKYTGGVTPRVMGMQMHFYMAALLTLPEEEVAKIIDCMRSQGAEVELGPFPASRVRSTD